MSQLAMFFARGASRRATLTVVVALCLLGALMIAVPAMGVYYHA